MKIIKSIYFLSRAVHEKCTEKSNKIVKLSNRKVGCLHIREILYLFFSFNLNKTYFIITILNKFNYLYLQGYKLSLF